MNKHTSKVERKGIDIIDYYDMMEVNK